DLAEKVELIPPAPHPGLGDFADLLRSLGKLLVSHDLDHRQRRGARQGVAGEGAAKATWCGTIHDLAAADDGRDRHASAKRLRQGQEAWLQVPVLGREELARASEPRLHLVEDENDAFAPAHRRQGGQEIGRRDDEAALTLDRLAYHPPPLFGGGGGAEKL